MSDSSWARTHAIADWRLKPALQTNRPNSLASLVCGTIPPAICGRRAFCFAS
jgi:hypothetical protein